MSPCIRLDFDLYLKHAARLIRARQGRGRASASKGYSAGPHLFEERQPWELLA
jgi:hypothetical protein